MTIQTDIPPRILIADDQADILSALELLLKAEGYDTESVISPAAVLDAVHTRHFDVLLIDLNYARDTTSGQEGLDLLAHIQAFDPMLPVVAMTAWGSVEVAVEAMRGNLRDFIQKPWDNERLLDILRTQIDRGRHVRRTHDVRNQEMEEAREIQQGLMPTRVPFIPGYDIAHDWRPAQNVGGDYIDVVPLSDHAIGLCIADVVGKGMPAALLMSNVQALVHAFASETLAPHVLCAKVNRTMAGNMPANKFVTFFYACLDARTHRFVYANAGHNDPILVRHDGTVSRLTTGGVVLGVFSDGTYEQGEITLAAGDRIVLFTDGVNEAMSPGGEEFGDDRLVELVTANRTQDAAALQQSIMDAVADFCQGQYHDDVTVMALAVR